MEKPVAILSGQYILKLFSNNSIDQSNICAWIASI